MPRMSWCSILGGLAQNLFIIMASGLVEECQKLRVYSQSVGIVRKHLIKESDWPFIDVKKFISRTLSNHHCQSFQLFQILSHRRHELDQLHTSQRDSMCFVILPTFQSEVLFSRRCQCLLQKPSISITKFNSPLYCGYEGLDW